MGGGTSGEHGAESVELGVIILTPRSMLPAPCYSWQAEQLYTAPCDVQTQRVIFFNKWHQCRAEKVVHFREFSQRAPFGRLQKRTASA